MRMGQSTHKVFQSLRPCLRDLRPLDTAIMNASVSIDRVIWIIVIGPSLLQRLSA